MFDRSLRRKLHEFLMPHSSIQLPCPVILHLDNDDVFGCYLILSDIIGCYLILSNIIGCYLIPLDVIGCYLISLDLIGCYMIL